MLQSQIIKQRKKQLRLKIVDIMEATGASRPSVCRWLSGETSKISPDKLQKLADVLQTTPDHLLGRDDVSVKKPILGFIQEGYDMFAEENILGYEEVSALESKQGDFYLRMSDDSMMNARICDGDLLYIQLCKDVESGQIALLLIQDREACVRRVIKKDDLLILEAGNSHMETCYFNQQEISELPVRIIGRVVHNKIHF